MLSPLEDDTGMGASGKGDEDASDMTADTYQQAVLLPSCYRPPAYHAVSIFARR